MLPGLRGLAIRDRNGHRREDSDKGGLTTSYWRRYEIENYIVSPQVLRAYTAHEYRDLPLFNRFRHETDEVLDELIMERVFEGRNGTSRHGKAWILTRHAYCGKPGPEALS